MSKGSKPSKVVAFSLGILLLFSNVLSANAQNARSNDPWDEISNDFVCSLSRKIEVTYVQLTQLDVDGLCNKNEVYIGLGASCAGRQPGGAVVCTITYTCCWELMAPGEVGQD